MILTPRNWKDFQHYKDRSPAWIKLHRGLLDDLEYHQLSPEAGKALPLIWLIASEKDGVVPAGAELAFRLRIPEELANDVLVELMESHFLVTSDSESAEQGATQAQRRAKSNGFGNRHISDTVKRAVWARDGGKCCQCGSEVSVEYDHKHPVSKGGNSEEDNIQLLCRPCNRRKRTKVATPAQPLRSLEERRGEGEKEYSTVAKATRTKSTYSEEFEDFWRSYPRTPTMSKSEAWKAWQRMPPEDHAFACQALEPYKRHLKTKPTLETVHACRFLSQRRFDGFRDAPAAQVLDIRSHLV